MAIGTIVSSNSHISYSCRIYGDLESESTPAAAQYGFGTFVTFGSGPGSELKLVGVIRDTLLVNPEYGNYGPRLSPETELSVFSPDYLNEKGIVVEIVVVGWLNGGSHHEIPPVAGQVGAEVEVMEERKVVRFHTDKDGSFFMGYLPQLASRSDPVTTRLLLKILQDLEPAFPEDQKLIEVLKGNLAWRAQIAPAG